MENNETTDGNKFTCTENPGFTTIFTKKIAFNFEYEGEYYGKPTGLFNDDYAHFDFYKPTYKHFYHEGIDFYGPAETDVVSLIYAKVLNYGWFGSYGNTLILASINTKGIYLLGHLTSKSSEIKIDSIVEPHDIIAKTGNTTTYKNMNAHLHVSYYDYIYDEKELVNEENDNLSWVTNNWKPNDFLRNPFDHVTPKKENEKW